jgi:hypothetical protein
MKMQIEFKLQYLFHLKSINLRIPSLTMYLLSLMEKIYVVVRDLIRNDCCILIINAINIWWFMIRKSIDEI